MAPSSDLDVLVLHGLRLTTWSPADALAERAGAGFDEVSGRLDRFADKGWTRYREGVPTGWMLTPAGRVEALRLVAHELAATDTRAHVEQAYREFLRLNPELLQVCTDWQLRPIGASKGGSARPTPVINDHSDAGYDATVIAALQQIDEQVQPIGAALAGALQRFESYGPRLGAALDRVVAGEGDWFAKPTIDSYHTVWFQLHEDLLATLGLERANEQTTRDG